MTNKTERIVMTKELYRHGDLLLKPSAKRGNWERKETLTLALGEATGHHHTLYPVEAATVIETLAGEGYGNATRFRVRGGKAELRHQEHHTLTILPGTYDINREREYDYFENEMKRVVD